MLPHLNPLFSSRFPHNLHSQAINLIMTQTPKPPTRFGLETCQDMYEKLKWEAQRLEEGWSVYGTFNFVVTAHHLYVDWIKSCGSQDAKAKKASIPAPAKLVLQSIVDLSNGNKHWKMEKENSIKKQVITKVDEPIIGDWYSYLVVGPMAYVDFDNYSLSMMELTYQVLGYFKWIFEDGDIAFPRELLNHLETCRTGSSKQNLPSSN